MHLLVLYSCSESASSGFQKKRSICRVSLSSVFDPSFTYLVPIVYIIYIRYTYTLLLLAVLYVVAILMNVQSNS